MRMYPPATSLRSLKVWCSCPARAALRFAGRGTKLAELPIPANHRNGAALGWSGEVRQMSPIWHISHVSFNGPTVGNAVDSGHRSKTG
jgi:hypothetical protein